MTKTTIGSEFVFTILNEIGIISQLATSELKHLIGPELGTSEFSLLNHLVRLGDGKSPTHLARAFQITKASMTAILAKLVAKGCVRIEGVPEDGRQKRVFITPAGRKLHEKAVGATLPAARQILDSVGADRLEALAPHLTVLRTYLDKARNERDGL